MCRQNVNKKGLTAKECSGNYNSDELDNLNFLWNVARTLDRRIKDGTDPIEKEFRRGLLKIITLKYQKMWMECLEKGIIDKNGKIDDKFINQRKE